MIGTRLGPYEIVEQLGKGGMATVYRAFHPAMERFVAVKIIHRALAQDVAGMERFRQEARLIARLEHPHLLPVYDYKPDSDPPYIVMRYLEGSTLKEVIEGKRILPLNEIAYLMRQIASALDYAHRSGVIHRDIKPSNIMVDADGNTFLTDFGIARITGEAGMTQTGYAVGTPGYMSPEQGMGLSDITPQTDIYSLGVMAYEMATGQAPFTGDTPMAVLLQHIQEPVPSAVATNPELPETFDEIIDKTLAKEPEARYATAGEFAAALSRLVDSRELGRTPENVRTVAVKAIQDIQQSRNESEIQRIMDDFEGTRSSGMLAAAPVTEPDAPTTLQKTPPETDSKSRLPLIIGAVVILVAVIGIAFLLLGGGDGDADATATAEAIAANDSATESAIIAQNASEEPSATNTPRDDSTATDEPTATDQPTNTPSPTNTRRPTNTPTPTPTATRTPTPNFPLLELRRPLQARVGPADDYASLLELGQGEQLEITGLSQDGRWYQVVLPTGATGWIPRSLAFMQLYGPQDEVQVREGPSRTPPPTNTPNRTATVIAITGTANAEATSAEATSNARATERQATVDAQATATRADQLTATAEAQATASVIAQSTADARATATRAADLTATADAIATDNAQATTDAQSTADDISTQLAIATERAQATADTQATADAIAMQNAQATEQQATANAIATADAQATADAIATADAQATTDAIATQNALATTNVVSTQYALATNVAISTQNAQATADAEAIPPPTVAVTQEPPGRMPFVMDFETETTALLGSDYDPEVWQVVTEGGQSLLIGQARPAQPLIVLGSVIDGNPEWATTADFVVSFRVNLDADEGARLIFRYQEGIGYNALDIRPGLMQLKRNAPTANPLTDQFSELRLRGGLYNAPIQRNQWYDVKVWVEGQRIFVYLDDDLVMTAEDLNTPQLGAGQIMLQTGNAFNPVRFDDLVIQRAEPGSDHFQGSGFPITWQRSSASAVDVGRESDGNQYIQINRSASANPQMVPLRDVELACRIYSIEGGYTLYLRESNTSGSLRLTLEAGEMQVEVVDAAGQLIRTDRVRNFYTRGLWQDLHIFFVDNRLQIILDGDVEYEETLDVDLQAGTIRFETDNNDIVRIDDCLLTQSASTRDEGASFAFELIQQVNARDFRYLRSDLDEIFNDEFRTDAWWVDGLDATGDYVTDASSSDHQNFLRMRADLRPTFRLFRGNVGIEMFELGNDRRAFSDSTDLLVTVDIRLPEGQAGEAWVGIRSTPNLTGNNIQGYRLVLRRGLDGSLQAAVDFSTASSFDVYFEGDIPGADTGLPEWIPVTIVTYQDKLAFFVNDRFLTFVDNAEKLGGSLALGVSRNTVADFDTLIIRDTSPHGE